MDSDNLEKLRERLYKKDESFSERKKRWGIRMFNRGVKSPPTDWQHSYGEIEKKLSPFPMKKIFIIVIIFLVLSVIAVLFFLTRGLNIISSGNIAIDIKGPVHTYGGETITLDVFVENKNDTPLEMASLLLEFPEGAFSEDGTELVRERYSMGEIGLRGSVKKSINLVLFGEEDEEKNIKTTLEYRLEGSNAIFAKDAEYTVKISRPAVGILISAPKEINSRQEMKMDINIVSNAENVIRNLVLQIEYPSGFQFSKSVPEPTTKNNTWLIGDLGPTQQRNISLYGIIEGQDLEEKSFRVQAGVMNKDNVFISYGTSAETIAIKKPFLDLTLFLNGENTEKNIVSPGNYVKGEIFWKNNLPTNIVNAVMELKIKGITLNEKSISVSNGTYRTFDKTLVWNSSGLPGLNLISPGETGSGRFSFSVLSPLPIISVDDKNFIINIEVQIKGKTVSESLGATEISNTITKDVKVASFLQLASQALHYSGDFENTGPMPPKVGSETTYTIVWSIGNTSNDFSDVKVRAALPSYARWLSKVSPAGEEVAFDEKTGEVVWSIHSLSAGTGILWPAKKVSFQISLMPSLSQAGSSPVLVSDINMTGKDNFTETIAEEKKQDLNTILSNDPKFNYKEGRVTQ